MYWCIAVLLDSVALFVNVALLATGFWSPWSAWSIAPAALILGALPVRRLVPAWLLELQVAVVTPVVLAAMSLHLHAFQIKAAASLLLICTFVLQCGPTPLKDAAVGVSVVVGTLALGALLLFFESVHVLGAVGSAIAIVAVPKTITTMPLLAICGVMILLTASPFVMVLPLTLALVVLWVCWSFARAPLSNVALMLFGASAALLVVGSGAFTTQPYAALPASLTRAQLFTEEQRAFVRANEADVRLALTDAMEWRQRFTFATSFETRAASGVEHVLRKAPLVWRFVAIGLLGAFDGHPDADDRAAALWRTFFGEPPHSEAVDSCAVDVLSETLSLFESTHSATLKTELGIASFCRWNDELLITFRVPDGALVSGLELNGRAALAGASDIAAAAYEDEIVRRVDPALIEKVAPNTFRLRVGPLTDETTSVAWNVTLIGGVGTNWTLPRAVEMRSVRLPPMARVCVRSMRAETPSAAAAGGSSAAQQRIAAAWNSLHQSVEMTDCEPNRGGWLDGTLQSLPRSAASLEAGVANVTVAVQTSANVTGVVRIAPMQPAAHRALLRTGAPIAIVVDRSASIREHAATVAELLKEAHAAKLNATVFWLASPRRKEPPVVEALTDSGVAAANNLDAFGSQTHAEQVMQFDWLQSLVGAPFSAAMLVTTAADRLDSDGAAARFNTTVGSVPFVMLGLGTRPLTFLDARIRARIRATAATTGEALWRVRWRRIATCEPTSS